MEEIKKLVKPYFIEWQTEAEITAVLKYIEKNIEYIKRILIKEDIIEIEKGIYTWTQFNSEEKPSKIFWWSIYYEIPNKPLHLFSEIEEQELLSLLLKLK